MNKYVSIFTHDKFSIKQGESKPHKIYIGKKLNNDAWKYINLFDKHIYDSEKKKKTDGMWWKEIL